ncbi:MAG: beta-galactosidase [Bacteroidales bacterium]|nr:beta-galactosidase [Bacteroidales bacterium]
MRRYIFIRIIFAIAIIFYFNTCDNSVPENKFIGTDSYPAGIFPPDASGIWVWYSTGGAPNKWNGKIKPDETYPGLRGIPIVIGWNELEPEEGVYKWELIDDIIKKAAENNKYVFTLLWLNPVNPDWLFDKGVPEVKINTFKTDPNFASIPYPLDENYKFYSERIITKLADHLRNLPPELFKHILFHQVVEGSTGDGFCYKGDPENPEYHIERDDWAKYQDYIRKFTINAFTDNSGGKPEIPLLIHNEDIPWIAKQYEGFIVKKGVASHFYHNNNSRSKNNIYKPYHTPDNELGRPVFSRGEGETMWSPEKKWFQKDSLQNLYWSALYALHCGLDIWNIPDHVLENPRWYMALDMFDKYAGNKYPEKSNVAFCAMREELNADDSIRFPVEIYGPANKNNFDRVLKIESDFKERGAVVEDLELTLAGSLKSRKRMGYNDVGWDRIDDDYNLYLYPVDKLETSIGWWHVGPKDQPYGRFARGFEHESGKDTLFFKFHKDFFRNNKNEKKTLQFKIIWFDNNEGEWKFSYDNGKDDLKTGAEFKGEGSMRWKEEIVKVEDAVLNGNGPRDSDIALINTDNKDNIFHIIEVVRIVNEETKLYD